MKCVLLRTEKQCTEEVCECNYEKKCKTQIHKTKKKSRVRKPTMKNPQNLKKMKYTQRKNMKCYSGRGMNTQRRKKSKRRPKDYTKGCSTKICRQKGIKTENGKKTTNVEKKKMDVDQET